MDNVRYHYDELIDRSLLRMVRDILRDVQSQGLSCGHHFYMTFRTPYPGNSLPDHLLEQYPQSMTIVLENKFWDLSVEDDFFRVKLKFGHRVEDIVVYFQSLLSFSDPSCDFMLSFYVSSPDYHEPIQNDLFASGKDKDKDNVVALDFFRKNEMK